MFLQKFIYKLSNESSVRFNDPNYLKLELEGLKISYRKMLSSPAVGNAVHPIVHLQRGLMQDINGYHVRTSLIPYESQKFGRALNKDEINLKDTVYNMTLNAAGKCENGVKRVSLDPTVIVTGDSVAALDPVWHQDRLVHNIMSIGKDVSNQYTPAFDNNDFATYYIFPLNIVVIPNGIHSVFAASLKDEAQYSIHAIVDLSNEEMFQNFNALKFLTSRFKNPFTMPSLTLWANMIEASRELVGHPEIAPKQIQPFL
jgi:hypothetical protein